MLDKLIEIYDGLPDWAKDELFRCSNGWEYSGNKTLGWDKTSSYFLEQPLANGLASGRIPSSLKYYLEQTKWLLHSKDSSSPPVYPTLTAKKLNDKYTLTVKYNWGESDQKMKLSASDDDSLICAMKLYAEATTFYEDNAIPCLSELRAVEDTFEDRDGVWSINFKDHANATNLYSKYKRFCFDIKADGIGILDANPYTGYSSGYGSPTSYINNYGERLHFSLRMVEGNCRIYSRYNEVKNKVYLQGFLNQNTTITIPNIITTATNTTQYPLFPVTTYLPNNSSNFSFPNTLTQEEIEKIIEQIKKSQASTYAMKTS